MCRHGEDVEEKAGEKVRHEEVLFVFSTKRRTLEEIKETEMSLS
jgi:hypothetical protein